MYINAFGNHVPQNRISNDYFQQLNGLSNEWILQRTGIATRSRIAENEDLNSIGIEAVRNALENLPYDINGIDLIISAGYCITDTVGTLAHYVQKEFNISNAQVVAITSACSSFVNATEIVQGYFAMGKATKALIVCSEVNSVFSNDSDKQSGHLWGDAAVAVFLSDKPQRDNEPKVIDSVTKGLGHIGKGPKGVYLLPKTSGIVMEDGKDVFHHACIYMTDIIKELTSRNNLSIDDIAYFACHQANMRIIANVAQQLNLSQQRLFNNINELGNTGSASSILALLQNIDKIKNGDIVALSVFGGGYSCGGLIIRF